MFHWKIVADWPYHIIRLLLAGVFLYAGSSKLMDPEAFAVVIEAFGLVPDGWTGPLSFWLPLCEVAAAVALVLDLRGSLGAVGFLLVLFLAVLGYGLWLGLDVDCGCFGPDDAEARAYSGLRPSFHRDWAMVAGVIFLYVWRGRRGLAPLNPLVALKGILKEDKQWG
ncbi:MAG: MauE/DoxX family redox-associated membrane protein [Desulfobacterales bacterium]